MKYLIIFSLIAFSFQSEIFAQKYMTRTGHIWFFSHTDIEDIEAHNHQSTSIIDLEKGEMAFAVLMNGFQFEKALMQEHFREKYVESEKFPKASFKGRITNADDFDFSKEGTYEVKVSGELTIHGVTKEVETTGTLQIKGEEILGKAKFQVEPEAFDIKIPSVVRDNIAKNVDVNVDIKYTALNQ